MTTLKKYTNLCNLTLKVCFKIILPCFTYNSIKTFKSFIKFHSTHLINFHSIDVCYNIKKILLKHLVYIAKSTPYMYTKHFYFLDKTIKLYCFHYDYVNNMSSV